MMTLKNLYHLQKNDHMMDTFQLSSLCHVVFIYNAERNQLGPPIIKPSLYYLFDDDLTLNAMEGFSWHISEGPTIIASVCSNLQGRVLNISKEKKKSRYILQIKGFAEKTITFQRCAKQRLANQTCVTLSLKVSICLLCFQLSMKWRKSIYAVWDIKPPLLIYKQNKKKWKWQFSCSVFSFLFFGKRKR